MSKTIEVDEQELTNLRSLHQAFQKMSGNQQAGLLLEQAYKHVDPNARTPRMDAEKARTASGDELRKELSDLKKQIADEKAETEKNNTLRALQERIDTGNAKLLAEGWTPDGIKLLDEFRQKENIIDPLAAAAYYEKLHGPQVQPAVPSSGIGRWDFTDIPEGQEHYAKKLLDTKGENETLVMQEAMKALKEFQGPQRR